MNTEADLLRALHTSPDDDTCWLALADALEETGQSERAEITRLLTWLRRTLDHADRPAREERLRSLLVSGVRPCVPEIVNSLGMRFALIPPGVFRMGSEDSETAPANRTDEQPRHRVEITRPFYLGVFPLTQKEYRTVLRTNPSTFQPGHPILVRDGITDTSDFPVNQVIWKSAVRVCERLSDRAAEKRASRVYRLPTEGEWEYACRAGTTSAYHFGDGGTSTLANFDAQQVYRTEAPGVFLERPTVVGSYPPNAFGLFDMHGNVNEWCSDWYAREFYDRGPEQDPTGPKSSRVRRRVFRGGCWNFYAVNCRAAYRGSHASSSRWPFLGVRVALTWNPAVSGEAHER
jgi:uncharacterized protein (TIGR02996 family)